MYFPMYKISPKENLHIPRRENGENIYERRNISLTFTYKSTEKITYT